MIYDKAILKSFTGIYRITSPRVVSNGLPHITGLGDIENSNSLISWVIKNRGLAGYYRINALTHIGNRSKRILCKSETIQEIWNY